MKNLHLAMAVLFLRLPGLSLEPDNIVLLVQQAIQSNDLDTASRLIASALSRHPDGGLYNLRGIVHARRNELLEARKDFADAVRLEPHLTAAWQNLARACRFQAERAPESMDCAISASQKVLQLKPDDVEARSSLAALLLQEQQFGASLHTLEKLPPPDSSQVPNLLVRCVDLVALGRLADATSVASRLVADPDFSPSDLAPFEASLSSPNAAPVLVSLLEGLDARKQADLTTLRKLAIAYEQSHRPKDARKALERLAILDPHNKAHLLELARLADADQDHESALGYLAHARDLDPNDPQIHFLFAMIASEMELPMEARASLNRALALDPGNPAYNFAMGTVILTTRDAATASDYFKKFLAVRPDDPKGHYALGVADYTSGDYVNSKKEMQRVECDPKLAGGAAYFLGRMDRLDDNLPAAKLHLLKAIALMPDFAESHTELARVFMLEENPQQARSELQRALELDPRSFQANMQLLALYKRAHDPRSEEQSNLVKQLDEARSKRAELMLRGIELRP